MNNNSVAQETSTKEVFTETVQDTQTQNQKSPDSALQIIVNELYNHIA